MAYLFLLGRILFGGFFVLSAIESHFMGYKGAVGYAKMKKVPLPEIGVLVSGAMIFLGGLGVILGVYTTVSLWLIILFLLPVSFMMHAFWADTDPNTKMVNKIMFSKNLALLGAALMLLNGY